MPQLTPGQELFYVPYQTRSRKGATVKVVKTGRKWAELQKGYPRIDMETMQADGHGYSSPGRCWLSEADYNAAMDIQSLWNKFASRVWHNSLPAGITEHAIRHAAALLDIPLDLVS